MSEKKIVVPDGMFHAALSTYAERYTEFVSAGEQQRNSPRVLAELEAALRWLSEHPIVPTVEDILEEAKAVKELDAEMHIQWIGWWMRHVFLERKRNPVVNRVRDAVTGCTLTDIDAEQIIDAVLECTDPSKVRSLRYRIGVDKRPATSLALDPLVMYIMRHFDDVELDERSRRNRAEAAIADFTAHMKRSGEVW